MDENRNLVKGLFEEPIITFLNRLSGCSIETLKDFKEHLNKEKEEDLANDLIIIKQIIKFLIQEKELRESL